jgi:transcriptional regulator with XRE-family HTH domain
VPSIRDIRLATGHSQRAFAVLLDVPFQTYRPYDSDRRPVPPTLVQRAERVLDEHRRETELFTLDALADEFSIHPRTLRAAARDGRLRVQFSTRSAFGRPVRRATRAAIDEFVRLHYRQRYSRNATPLPRPRVIVVPTNFPSWLIGLRLRLRLTQADLARRIGAANKSVIYQWETRRRTPSIVFWSRVEQLTRASS